MREDFSDARILIVDDEKAYVQLLEHFLASAGYRDVRSTTSAHDVIPLVGAFRPDLILLDLHMPEVDGIELLRELEPYTATTFLPVLMLTGDISDGARKESLAGGAKDFLNKPFDLLEARLRIENLLERRYLHLAMRRQERELEERVRERTAELEAMRIELLERFSLAVDYRDDATGRHTQSVGNMAGRIAQELGLPPDQVEHIRLGAALHDIGKVGISDAVLLKPGELTAAEVALMKTHTTLGAKLLSGGRSRLLQTAELIAAAHHERWDGLGYPRGLQGEQIPLPARIAALADVVDALSSDRPYRARWPADRIRTEIVRQSGRQFDPGIVDAYLRIVARADEREPEPLQPLPATP